MEKCLTQTHFKKNFAARFYARRLSVAIRIC